MAKFEDMATAYYKIFIKTLELRNLLADILIRFRVIDHDNNESFYQLLSYIPQIETIYPYTENPDILKTFDTTEEIQNFLYTKDTESDHFYTNVSLLQRTVPEINQIIIDTFLSYNNFLIDYLFTVGLSSDIIYQENTLKHYIECLYQIERQINTTITVTEDVLYRNVENGIGLTVTDDMDNVLESGIIIIRENGIPIYEGSVMEVYIKPSTMGQHTYTFEYISDVESHYKRSELTKTFTVQASPISIEVKTKNINESSFYYESTNEGYAEDYWEIEITTKSPTNEMLPDIPIKIYVGNKLVCEDYTNIFGTYTYVCRLPYSSDFDDYVTTVNIQTASFNTAYINTQEERIFTIYHHLFEADNEYYIEQKENVKIRLLDQLTGEPLQTITVNNENEEDFDVIEDDVDIQPITMIHPFFAQNIQVEAVLGDQHRVDTLSSDNNIWEYSSLSLFTLQEGDVIALTITIDDYQETQNVYIKSNFIVPEKNIFYLPEYPTLYFKPLGKDYDGNGEINVYCSDTGSGFGTSAIPTNNGVIELLSTLGEWQATLTGYHYANMYRPEEIRYDYSILPPLQLIQYQYDQTTCAKYVLYVYDKQSLDRLENHITVDGYEQYTIKAPNEISIDLLNDSRSIINIYDADTNIVDIINEHNKIIFDNEEYNFNKNSNQWNNVLIKIEQPNPNDNVFTYKFYVDNELKHQIQSQHNDEIRVLIIVPSQQHYDNFKIKKLNTPITVMNNNNEEVDYVYVKTERSDRYIYDIHICRNEYNQGMNTICASLNNYTKCDNFELYDASFYIIPSELKVGNNTIQIQCFDDTMNTLEIIHNSIVQKTQTKQGDIFTINCDIYEAGSLSIQLRSDNYSENFVIHVDKGDYIIDLDMPETKQYGDHTAIPLHIKDAFNNEVNSFYCWFDESPPNQTLLINKGNNDGIVLNNTAIGRQFDTLDMGTHYITVQPLPSNNYNPVSVTQEFVLGVYISTLTDQPLFTNLAGDNDGWLVNESILVDNETTIGDLEDVLIGINTSVNVDPGELLLSNFISSNPDLDSIILLNDDFNNIQNAIISIDVQEDKLTYDTIEDDNL